MYKTYRPFLQSFQVVENSHASRVVFYPYQSTHCLVHVVSTAARCIAQDVVFWSDEREGEISEGSEYPSCDMAVEKCHENKHVAKKVIFYRAHL